MSLLLRLSVAASVALWVSGAGAETYRVDSDDELYGKAREVEPGDVVEIEPGKYTKGLYLKRSGTADKPITLRGVVVDGKRPFFTGTEKFTIVLEASHYLIENIEITGTSSRCFFHAGHDVTLRNVSIHDCPEHGLLSADEGSGSLWMDRCELYGNGEGDRHHQIYTTSDQDAHPGAVFRLTHSYIHDGKGGNNVKSRAQRNEIHYNWIEGAYYHELELIGPDAKPAQPSREDSEVVGNVLWQRNEAYAIRVGGDGTSDTDGRYRFVNNTFIVPAKHRPPLRLFDGIESLELYNNVFFAEGGGPITLIRDKEVRWTRGHPVIFGSHNYLPSGSSDVPSALKNTIEGDPIFVGLAAFDLRPATGSPLIDKGATTTTTNPDAPFPSPLALVNAQPPNHRAGITLARPVTGPIDVGAYESGSSLGDGAPSAPVGSAGAAPTAPTAPPQPVTPGGPKRSRCSCHVVGAPAGDGWWSVLALLAFVRRSSRNDTCAR